MDSRRDRFESVAPGLIDPVRRFLARRTDPDTAEDVLAETLLVCWRRADDLPEPLLPWVYGVARNCLHNAERSARRQRRVAARVATVDPPAESSPGPEDRDDEVTAALAALRPQDAELLRLWAWEQLDGRRDRDRARDHPERGEHPAAPRARQAGATAAKDRGYCRT